MNLEHLDNDAQFKTFSLFSLSNFGFYTCFVRHRYRDRLTMCSTEWNRNRQIQYSLVVVVFPRIHPENPCNLYPVVEIGTSPNVLHSSQQSFNNFNAFHTHPRTHAHARTSQQFFRFYFKEIPSFVIWSLEVTKCQLWKFANEFKHFDENELVHIDGNALYHPLAKNWGHKAQWMRRKNFSWISFCRVNCN